MCPPNLMLVTCAVCVRLHEPKNPFLTNSICVSCAKPKSEHPDQPR